ncbi:MAG: site-specific DNA-methyltransferase [Mycobacteriaceae bacterium]|nr:site-specific DNA-methyltransferase [Mycobacteriaceae bacterium]
MHADWFVAAGSLSANSVDLLYTDPPFNTGVAKRTPPRAARVGRRVARAAFDDRLRTGAEFAQWLRVRLDAALPALKPSANVLVHVDWRTCHHVRLMLDRLLGEDRFVNHLIWSYGLGGSSPKRFARKHDDILLYCVDPARAYFRAPRVPATSNRMKGMTKKATDVLQIPSLNNMSSERTGYPTQKPLALLKLLVEACCPPGGLVLDPTCGSGTTLVAAVRSGRNAVGFDLSGAALRTARKRLGPPA